MRSAASIGETARLLSPSSARKPDQQLDEQRGRRNFLTWAFFLAQVSAAEALLTGPARAQDDEDWVNAAKQSTPPLDQLPDETFQQRMDVAEAATAAPPSGGSPGAPSPFTPLMTPDQTKIPVAPNGGQTPPGGTVGAGGGGQGRVGSSGDAQSSIPEMLPDLHFGIQMAPQPLHADVSLALLGFNTSADVGGLAAINLNLNLNNLIPDPLEGVTNLVGALTPDLGDLLGNLLNNDGLAGGVLGGNPQTNTLNLSELTGLTLTNGITGLLGGRDEDAPAAQSQSGNEQTAFVSDADEFSAPALLSGGTLNFPAGETNTPPPDELFAGGRHTDYNIALGDTSERDAPPLQSDTSDLPEATPAPDGQHHDDQPAVNIAIADMSSLDDFVTRPTI